MAQADTQSGPPAPAALFAKLFGTAKRPTTRTAARADRERRERDRRAGTGAPKTTRTRMVTINPSAKTGGRRT